MDSKSIRKEITTLIDGIKEHSDNLTEVKHIPQLEWESILTNIKTLYEKSVIFNYLNALSLEHQSTDLTDRQATLEEKAKVNSADSSIEQPTQKQATMDLFSNELAPATKSIQKEEHPTVVNLQKRPITDLKSAIGINDKFQFINELFDGNMQEYNLALNQLNTMADLKEASYYLHSLKDMYKWKEENGSAQKFTELVERRFP